MQQALNRVFFTAGSTDQTDLWVCLLHGIVISLASEYHHHPSVMHLSTRQGISLFKVCFSEIKSCKQLYISQICLQDIFRIGDFIVMLQTGFGPGSRFLPLGTGLESDSKNLALNTSSVGFRDERKSGLDRTAIFWNLAYQDWIGLRNFLLF